MNRIDQIKNLQQRGLGPQAGLQVRDRPGGRKPFAGSIGRSKSEASGIEPEHIVVVSFLLDLGQKIDPFPDGLGMAGIIQNHQDQPDFFFPDIPPAQAGFSR